MPTIYPADDWRLPRVQDTIQDTPPALSADDNPPPSQVSYEMVPTHREEHILKWDTLLTRLSSIDVDSPTQPSHLFRGQPDDSWSLKPSLVRHADASAVEALRALEVEADVLKIFQSQAHLHIPESVLRNAERRIDWWTLMQHYGAKTRTLDWTFSPHIAAYFAAESCFDKDGAVWVVDAPLMDHEMEEPPIDPDSDPYLGLSAVPFIRGGETKFKTDRMIAQQGAFTVCTYILADHAEVLDKLMPPNEAGVTFKRFTFPAKEKHILLHKLRRMNISAASLFPGIDGLGRSIAGLVDLGMRHS